MKHRQVTSAFCYDFYSKWSTLVVAVLMHLTSPAYCFDWSITEIHYQYASGWKYGDNFLFFDTIMPHGGKVDYYGEYYGNLSLSKITGINLAIGPVKDLGVIMGVNWAPTPGVLKFLPGMRIAQNFPGFAFLNSNFTAYIDESNAKIQESNSFMVDINGRYPFEFLNSKFSIEGHIEYIGVRLNPFGIVRSWFFYQIQFRYDLGHLLFNQPQKVFIGTEWQYWNHKLGTSTNENVFQALLVWRL